MLVVETVTKIRRPKFVQGKAICGGLRVPRKVLRRVVQSEETEIRYKREGHKPQGLYF